jgi:hypothetical protein
MPLKDLKINIMFLEEEYRYIFRVGSETGSATFHSSDPESDPKLFKKSDPDLSQNFSDPQHWF